MKKWILLTPVLALLLITGCSSKEEQQRMEETTDTVSTTDSSIYESEGDSASANNRDSSWMRERTSDSEQQQVFTDKKIVEKVQEELNDRGYSAGTTDGVLGRNTSNALSRFQRHEGIETTGRINQDTLRALNLEDMAQDSEAFSE